MKIFCLILALIFIAPITDAIVLHPENYGENSMQELAFLIVGLPILILNVWAWMYPEMLAFYVWEEGREYLTR
jgi:hypothetical protein